MDRWLLEDSNNTTYMSNDECMEIWNILKSWKLESVYQTCIGKNWIVDNKQLQYRCA